MSPRFATTHWSVVLSARDGVDEVAREALETLCQTYWYPLYAYVRGLGYDGQEAADLTQGFFTELLEKDRLRVIDPARGRFRSFLLASLKNFISHERIKKKALKRGGGTSTVSFDADEADSRYRLQPVDALTPELTYERHWGETVMDVALQGLEDFSQQVRGLEAAHFERLMPYITGSGPQIPYSEMASALDTSTSAIKSAVHRLRKKFGELLREQIAQTVARPEDVDDELRHLLNVVQPWEAQRT